MRVRAGSRAGSMFLNFEIVSTCCYCTDQCTMDPLLWEWRRGTGKCGLRTPA